ncbi:hypothetical protein [Nocardia mangyaensis]|uniref:hypothetical protein n=1 Tax=Nocardia mangyaensis TaxID=2213200 RepID=UPI00267601EF|nr:hypothetical protein [Nocardia mangyaensis]MDO3649353.1 hypothetical protein [Nocardia mangyaensis]
MQAPLRQTGILGRGPYGDLLTGASFAAIAVGLLLVLLGIAIGDSTIAKVSLLLLPFGAIGLADYYAEKGERSPAVHQTEQPGTVFLRFRPLRPLVTLVILAPIAGISAVFGWLQYGLNEVSLNGIILCVCVLFLATLMVIGRRSIRMTVSPASLRVQTVALDWEFDWDSILEINSDDTPHGDVITIMCDRAGIRRHREGKRVAAQWKSSPRERNAPWRIPADTWGVPTDLLVEALICLHEDPELREELSPALLTDLLTHGFESEMLDYDE